MNFTLDKFLVKEIPHVNAHIEDGLLTAFILPKEKSYHIEVKYSFIKLF